MSSWNPLQLNKMVLPPCHVSLQLYVDEKDRISAQMYQRSADLFLGVPWNITCYSILVHIFAHITGRKTGKLIIVFGDTHIYKNHKEQVKEQLTRTPFIFPTVKINKRISSIDELKFEDIQIENYISHPSIKAQMAV
jgi:thymidylate synthase